MKTVDTGFGVILAISARRSFAPASVCLASTTSTLVLPMTMVTLPPAPPSAVYTSGLSCLIVSGGGAGAWAVAGAGTASRAAAADTHTRVFLKYMFVVPFIPVKAWDL